MIRFQVGDKFSDGYATLEITGFSHYRVHFIRGNGEIDNCSKEDFRNWINNPWGIPPRNITQDEEQTQCDST